MKIKHPKIWIAVGVLAGIVLVITLFANRWLTKAVCAKIDDSIAQLDSMDIRYGNVRLSVLTGKVWINDVYMQSDTLYSQVDSTREMTRVEVERLSLDGVRYWDWLVDKNIVFEGITVEEPEVLRWFEQRDPDKETLSGLELERDMRERQRLEQQKFLDIARAFVDEATVERITVRHASMDMNAINSLMRTHVDDISFEIYGIGYSFLDSVPYHYNDSVFRFDIKDISVSLPDGQTRLFSRGMTARPGGVMRIDTTYLTARFSDNGHEYIHAKIDALRLGGFNAQKFNETKSLEITSLHVDHPTAEIYYHLPLSSAKTVKKTGTSQPTDTATTQPISNLNLGRSVEETEKITQMQQERMQEIENQVMMFLTEVNIDTIQIHDICGTFCSTGDHMKAQVDSLSLGVYGIGYSLIDSIPYHYNDSVFSFSVRRAHVITPDGLLSINTNNILYTDGGDFRIGRTHIQHTCSKWALSARMGNTPQAWMDVTIGEVRSRKNLVREARTLSNEFRLDSMYVRIDKLHIAKDERHQPKKPYPVLQSSLLDVKYPFLIRTLNVELRKMELELIKEDTRHIGKMALGPLYATVNNVTAVRNQTIRLKAHGNIGKGKLQMGMNIKVNKAGDWDMTLDARNMDMHFMDGFLRPIAGMQIGCNVSRLQAEYGGDGNLATGTFCMEYTDLSLEAFNDSPIKQVRDLCGLINSFAKTCLPHSNPVHQGHTPRAYKVKWKRDVMADPSVFYIGPLINGAMETLLPGIYAINKVKAVGADKEKKSSDKKKTGK